MGKYEKYIQYIVGDLIGLIEMDYKDEIIYEPFFMVLNSLQGRDEFNEFVSGKYGTKPSDNHEIHIRLYQHLKEEIHRHYNEQ